MRTVPHSDRVVIAGSRGTLWLTGETGLRPIGVETEAITSLACSPDARWLVVGTAVGRIVLHDLTTGAHHAIFSAQTWIEFVGFSSDSRQILFSTNGRMHLAEIEHEPDGEPRVGAGRGARELAAHHAAFSSRQRVARSDRRPGRSVVPPRRRRSLGLPADRDLHADAGRVLRGRPAPSLRPTRAGARCGSTCAPTYFADRRPGANQSPIAAPPPRGSDVPSQPDAVRTIAVIAPNMRCDSPHTTV